MKQSQIEMRPYSSSTTLITGMFSQTFIALMLTKPFFRMINIGTLLSILTTFVEKMVGFGVAYSIALGCAAISAALFQAGSSFYGAYRGCLSVKSHVVAYLKQ